MRAVPDIAGVWLLLAVVAAAVAVAAMLGVVRSRRGEPGRPVSETTATALAGVVGLGVATVALLMPIMPLLWFPILLAAVIVIEWSRRGSWGSLGAFLFGAGSLWAAGQALALADGSRSTGWSPIPLAVGVSGAILGAALLLLRDGDAAA
jgi:ABC-type Na+ efflux pump permease subunit